MFDHLVISDSYRRIVRSLVTVHSSSLKDQIMTDVVEGKGNGLIMCMHGKPGTGKVRSEVLKGISSHRIWSKVPTVLRADASLVHYPRHLRRKPSLPTSKDRSTWSAQESLVLRLRTWSDNCEKCWR